LSFVELKKFFDLHGETSFKTLIFVFGVWFFYYEFWPFVKTTIEQQRSDRRKEIDKLSKSIDDNNVANCEAMKEIVRELKENRKAFTNSLLLVIRSKSR
jgi:hypothetical protein